MSWSGVREMRSRAKANEGGVGGVVEWWGVPRGATEMGEVRGSSEAGGGVSEGGGAKKRAEE